MSKWRQTLNKRSWEAPEKDIPEALSQMLTMLERLKYAIP
jgi:hypothetical protein